MKKYEITENHKKGVMGFVVNQIRALIDIPRWKVRAGDLGGFVELDDILSHEGDCWIGQSAEVSGLHTKIEGDILIGQEAVIVDSGITGTGQIIGNATVKGCQITADGIGIFDRAHLAKSTLVVKNFRMHDQSVLDGVETKPNVEDFLMKDSAVLHTSNRMLLSGKKIRLSDNAKVQNCHSLHGENIVLEGDVYVSGGASFLGKNIFLTDAVAVTGNITLFSNVQLSEFVTLTNHREEDYIVKELTLNGDIQLLTQDL